MPSLRINRAFLVIVPDSKESVVTVVRRAIPRGNAPRAKKEERQKEKETVTKEKVKELGAGAKEFGK